MIRHIIITVILSLVAVKVRSTSLPITDDDRKAYVKFHNDVRLNVYPPAADMIELKHDQGLETLAKNYAKKCVWEHSDKSTRKTSKYASVGENLAYKWGTSYRPDTRTAVEGAVKGWADEVKDYDYHGNACTGVCGHYTQVVWAETETVGCAVEACDSIQGIGKQDGPQYLTVCTYGPAGNYVGQKPYINGVAKSKCPEGKTCLDNFGKASAGKIRTGFAVLFGCLFTCFAALFYRN